MNIIAGLGLFIVAGIHISAGQPRGRSDTIAVTNATVIDVIGGGQQTGVTVVTKGGQIAARRRTGR